MRLKELAAAVVVTTGVLALPAAAEVIDPVISSNEPLPFPQDAENEPALVIDRNPLRRMPFLVAGANDYRDQSVCRGSACAFADGIGISGVYWSGDGKTWVGGAYTGFAATATGTAAAAGRPIRTLPYYTSARWTRGDPGVAAGPGLATSETARPSWRNGTRFYYSTLVKTKTSHSVWVSSAQHRPSTPASKPNWSKPTWASRSATGWLDKPAIWVDNAASSPRFGNAYVCWTTFVKQAEEEKGQPPSGPIGFVRSTTGGRTWSRVTLPKGSGSGRHGCAVRTDSAGRVYVFWTELSLTPSGVNWLANPSKGLECRRLFAASIVMTESSNGTQFSSPRTLATIEEPGKTDHVQKRCTVDGAAGARTNSFPAVDIANGSPEGFALPHQDAIVVAWSAGPAGRIFLLARDNGVWQQRPQDVTNASDKAAAYPAVALAPNGANIYVVYNAFAQPWQGDVQQPPRWVEGVVRAATLASLTTGGPVPWGEVRGLPGDARGASNRDLTAEFLGDYSAVVATNARAYAAWTDASAALNCGAVTDYRQLLVSNKTGKVAGIVGKCPRTVTGRREGLRFGNVTICGAVLTASEAGSGNFTRVTDCKPQGR